MYAANFFLWWDHILSSFSCSMYLRTIWSPFGRNHGAQAATIDRHWRVFHMGKMDCYQTQNGQKVCFGQQQESSLIEFGTSLIVFHSFGFVCICGCILLCWNRFEVANVIFQRWKDAIFSSFKSILLAFLL